ncbi:MAG: MFS transporter [Microbacteriaceae bacterium]|nr:MAG: MFS transporter [Microbacteriaceae bacterium]
MSESTTATPCLRVQRRTLLLLSLAQVLSGVGAGAVVSTGSLLAVELSGSEAWAGSVTTTMTLGAAIASAVLMRAAMARGRRVALSAGLLVGAAGAAGVVLAAVTGAFWLLVAAGVLIGFGSAVNLQARFAATDLSEAEHRGRDLSLVVWMSTIGAVAGPNLVGAGGSLAAALGIPALSGLFVISAAGMLLGMAVVWVGLRPDPYLVLTGRQPLAGAELTAAPALTVQRPGPRQGIRALWSHPTSRAGLIGIVAAHAVMVAVMSMTPVHLTGHGASITIVGLTVSLHIAGMYALAPVMGVLTDRLGGRIVAAAGMVTLLVSVLLAGFSGDAHLVTVIGLILLGLGWSAATVAGSAMIVAATPVAERVAAQGASDTLMSLAGAVGGLLAGVALAAIGYLGLGVASAVIVLITLAVLTWTARTNRRTP